MKKIDLGQSIGILANLGVIAGIVFLAIELQQNNELLQAQARADQLDSRTAYIDRVLDGVAIGPIEYKAIAGEPLSPGESYLYQQFAINNFIQWEWQYREFSSGRLRQTDLPISGWRIVVGRSSIWDDAWQGYRNGSVSRSPGFVEFMEENVFAE